MDLLSGLSQKELLRLVETTTDRRLLYLLHNYLSNPLLKFQPRQDNPFEGDCQKSFIEDQFEGCAVAIGGNRSGKSEIGAVKLVRYILNNPPPIPDTPIWVIGKTYDKVCGICWAQKLSKYITPEMVSGIHWYKSVLNMPWSVILKKHSNGNNYVLHFKSSVQGIQKFTGEAIKYAWFDEQCPMGIIAEVSMRLVDWGIKGNLVYTLTPIEADDALEEYIADPQKYPHWKAYPLNTLLNTTIDQEALIASLESECEERRDTRLFGKFTSFEGQVYKRFCDAHIIKPFRIPQGWWHIRGVDFGWNDPTAVVYCAKDHDGRWYVYDEYCENKSTIEEHIEAIDAHRPWNLNSEDTGPSYGDPSAAQWRNEFTRKGFACELGRNEKEPGIAYIQSLLRPGKDGSPKLFIFDTCKKLIKEFRKYTYHPKIKGKTHPSCQDHCLDALRYALFTERGTTYNPMAPLVLPQRNGFHRAFTR